MRFSVRSLLARCAFALTLPIAALTLAAAPTGYLHAQAMPAGAKKPAEFPRTKLTVGTATINAAVAANEADREQGLMYRKHLAPNEGMLFVFGENALHCFWMKNTLIPLSIAFINAQGVITDIAEMQAETTNNHCPTQYGTYALEMRRGWFAAKRIQPGAQVRGLPQVQLMQ